MKGNSALSFAAAGWAAGVGATLLLGVVWPAAFPGIVNESHYYGTGPGLLRIILGVLVAVSPGAAVGGVIGSRIIREGGHTEQRLAAALAGIALSLPLGCLIFWWFSGF